MVDRETPVESTQVSIPKIFTKLGEFLTRNGNVETIGIFRLAGSSKEIKVLQDKLENGIYWKSFDIECW